MLFLDELLIDARKVPSKSIIIQSITDNELISDLDTGVFYLYISD